MVLYSFFFFTCVNVLPFPRFVCLFFFAILCCRDTEALVFLIDCFLSAGDSCKSNKNNPLEQYTSYPGSCLAPRLLT